MRIEYLDQLMDKCAECGKVTFENIMDQEGICWCQGCFGMTKKHKRKKHYGSEKMGVMSNISNAKARFRQIQSKNTLRKVQDVSVLKEESVRLEERKIMYNIQAEQVAGMNGLNKERINDPSAYGKEDLSETNQDPTMKRRRKYNLTKKIHNPNNPFGTSGLKQGLEFSSKLVKSLNRDHAKRKRG